MGLISMLKSIRAILRMRKEQEKKVAELRAMSKEEILAMDNTYFYDAISTLVDEKTWFDEVSECLDALKGAERTVYILNYFDREIQNGGLCQFFVNSSRDTAPYVEMCLKEVEAGEYAKLYSDFLKNNNISPHDLTSFIIDEVEEFEEQNEKYPFDDFDDTYYELYEKKPLCDIIAVYARKHIDDFIIEKPQE